MKVTLASHTPNPIEEVYKAYRICYSKDIQEEIKLPSKEDMIKFIVPLMKDGHTSPLEHVNLTFYINGVSRALLAQLTRHRTMSFNVQSQRYVDAKYFDYVMPDTVKDNNIVIEGRKASDVYKDTMEALTRSYELLQRYGVPKEDARFVLPNAATCNITLTVDLHNFRNFYGLRSCVHAQWEIRDLANEMMRQVISIVPFAGIGSRRCNKLCSKCFRVEGEE